MSKKVNIIVTSIVLVIAIAIGIITGIEFYN